jgi:hypothetical protein
MTAAIDAALMRDARKAGARLGCTLFATLLGRCRSRWAVWRSARMW